MSSGTVWIAFLRAINLGATRKFPKGDIVAAVERAGGREVITYINTGNVRLVHDLADRAEVERRLEEEFLADRGFEVPTICLSPAELRAVARDAEEITEPGRHYVSLLKADPTPDQVAALEGSAGPGERALVRGRGAHLLLAEGYRGSRLGNTLVERHCGVATNRNLNVIRTLAERWGGDATLTPGAGAPAAAAASAAAPAASRRRRGPGS